MRPVLFWVPLVHLPIYSYGVMLGLSLTVGWYLVLWLCQQDGMDRQKMGRLYTLTAVFSLAASRILFVLTNWSQFEDNLLSIFAVWNGGLVAYGGFLGGFLTGVIYCRRHKIRLLAWADCVVPSLGSGLFFTRIGCLLFGCDFGKVMDPPRWWAVTFPGPSDMAPKGSPAWAEQLAHHMISATQARSLPVHPTQIYEALVGATLFAVTMLVRRWRSFSGQMFIAFTMAYAVLRFYLETLRADEERGALGALSTSQIIGIVTFVAAGALYLVLRKRAKENPGALRLWENGQALVAEPVRGGAKKKRRRR